MTQLDQPVSSWILPVRSAGLPTGDADQEVGATFECARGTAAPGRAGSATERLSGHEARETVDVLIVDDDVLVRALLRDVLDREADLRIVGSAAGASAALDLTAQHAPAVIILDADLPGDQSAQVIDGVAETTSQSKVLLLTQEADEEALAQALRRGAHGYVAKHAAVSTIGHAVRALASGEAWVERRMTGRLLAELTRLARNLETPSGPGSSLSMRERQIVQYIAAGRTNQEIARALYLSPHTVKSHVSHILQKLDVPNRTEVAIFAVKAGWVSQAA